MEDKTADEIKKDIKLFNECIDRLKEIGNQNLSLFTNNLQQGNLNTIKFLFDKYIKRNKELEEENKDLKKYDIRNIKIGDDKILKSPSFTKEEIDLMNLGIALSSSFDSLFNDESEE